MKLRKPCNCSALIKAIDAYIAKADEDIEDNLKKSGFAVPKKTSRRMKEIEDEITNLLEEDNKIILNTINDYDDLKDFLNESWPELQDSQDLVEKLTRTFNRQFSEAVPEYTAEYLKRIESDAVLEAVSLTHQTTSWISSWSEELSRIMKLNDNSAIQKILDTGLSNGESIQEVSQRIADSGIREPGYRARRVATTEILRAHSVAQQESFMQSPAVEGKMWRHSGWREYARQNHIDMDDGTVVPKSETFTLYGADGNTYYPMYPRDSVLPPGESINCGCIAVPIVDESVLGLSLEERNQLRDEALAEINEEFDRKLDERSQAIASARYVAKPPENAIIKPVISGHIKERMEERGITETSVVEAVNNPIHVSNLRIDDQGRVSYQYIGREATVAYNPSNNTAASVWQTGERTRKRYEGDI